MEQQSLFDLNTIPEAAPETAKTASKIRWYITKMARDGVTELALMATHIDELDFAPVGTVKRQPLLYKTYGGAKRQALYYCGANNYTVKEWKGW